MEVVVLRPVSVAGMIPRRGGEPGSRGQQRTTRSHGYLYTRVACGDYGRQERSMRTLTADHLVSEGVVEAAGGTT